MKKQEVLLKISMESCYAQGVKCKKKPSTPKNHSACGQPKGA